MSSRFTELCIDCRDAPALAEARGRGAGRRAVVVLADPEGNEFCVLRTRRP